MKRASAALLEVRIIKNSKYNLKFRITVPVITARGKLIKGATAPMQAYSCQAEKPFTLLTAGTL
jgi:hypothetical protein